MRRSIMLVHPVRPVGLGAGFDSGVRPVKTLECQSLAIGCCRLGPRAGWQFCGKSGSYSKVPLPYHVTD